MTKQELLTRLATGYPAWAKARRALAWRNFQVAEGKEIHFNEEEWLAERERLLNKPSWADAPGDATHKAMDADGRHHFFIGEPHQGAVRLEWFPEPVSDGGWAYRAGKAIAIPAGYDWKESLEARPV